MKMWHTKKLEECYLCNTQISPLKDLTVWNLGFSVFVRKALGYLTHVTAVLKEFKLCSCHEQLLGSLLCLILKLFNWCVSSL